MDIGAMSKNRLEAFSDGVFAVALTLLILDVRVPPIASHSTLKEYALAMAPLVPQIIIFALTFVLICIHWVGHHFFFAQLHRVSIALVWLNNFYLLWICFMPFPTAMLGDHHTDQFPIILYGVNQLCVSLIFLSFRTYAIHNNLFANNSSAEAMGPKHSIPAVVIFTLSIVFAFLNVHISLACFIIAPVLYFVPTFIEYRNWRIK
jgi:uncharacterized membrane protein